MSIEEKVRNEVHPPTRIAWNGVQVMMVADITIQEIDGVIERLQTAKKTLSPTAPLILPAGPIEIALPR